MRRDTWSRLGWSHVGAALVALAGLAGCASSDDRGDRAGHELSPGEAAGESPSDHDAPPLGQPRAKKLPGDVPEEAEPMEDE